MQTRDSEVPNPFLNFRVFPLISPCLGRFARDSLSDKAKSAIENFEKAFQDLWQTLQDGFSVDHIMQTYRLVAATERSADIGKFPCSLPFP